MNVELPSIDFETYSEAGYVWNSDEQKWECLPGASQNKKGLGVVGSVVYAEHPSTEVLCAYYDMRDGQGEQLWMPSMPPPRVLLDYVSGGGLIEAFGVQFEYQIWNKVCCKKYGWPALKLAQLRCAQAKARAFGYPGKMKYTGPAMHLVEQKDAEGERLIKKFSVPRNPTKTDPRKRVKFVPNPNKVIAIIAGVYAAAEAEATAKGLKKAKLPKHHKKLTRLKKDAEDTLLMQGYCAQDVRTEIEISQKTPDLESDELLFFQCDRAMNVRGVALDIEGVENCIAIVLQAHEKYNAELSMLTGGAVEKASEIQKLSDWVMNRGVYVDSLSKDSLADMLTQPNLPPDVRRALELRQAVGSAAVKKVFAMINMVASDGRLHELFSYHAAHTGRVTGNGPQPTNMPNSGPVVRHCPECGEYWVRSSGDEKVYTSHIGKCCPLCGGEGVEEEWGPEAAEFALSVIASRELSYVEDYFADAMAVVSGCLRALFVAGPGKRFVGSDYTAIEAVVAAVLTGEEWRIEVFRTHQKIYEASASKITGVPFEDFMIHYGYTPEQLKQPEWWLQKPLNPGSHHPLRKKIGKYAELASGFGGWVGAWKKFGADEYLSEKEIKQGILAWRRESPSFPEMWGGQEREDKNGDKYPELFGLEGAAISAIRNPGKVFGYRNIWYKVENDVLLCRLPSGRKLAYHEPRIGERKGRPSIMYMGYNTNPEKGRTGWVEMDTYGGSLFENVVQATARDILRHATINLERAGYKIVLQVYDEVISEVPEDFGSVEEFERIMAIMPDWAKDWPIKAKGGFVGQRYRK